MRPRIRRILEHGFCWVVLIAAAAVVLHPVVLRGQVPAPVESIFAYVPWENARPADVPLLRAAIENPVAERFCPWFAFMREAARVQDTLLWSPYEACGTPFFAIWRTRCLSPFSAPFYFLPMEKAFQISLFAKLLVAGFCGFFLARRMGFALPLALFAGLSLELSGAIVPWLNWPMSDTVVWLPLFFLFTEYLTLHRFRVWPLGAVVFGLMLVGGAPETSFAAGLLMLLYLAMRHVFDKGARGRLFKPLLAFFGMTTAGLLLSAVQVLPFIEFALNAADTGGAVPGRPLGFTDIAAAFFPTLFGGFAVEATGQAASPGSQSVALLYTGLVNVLFLALWGATRPAATPQHRNRIDALVTAAFLMTILGVGVLPFIGNIPPFNWLAPRHLLIGNVLSLTLAAAASAEQWLELDAESCMRAVKRLLVFVPLLLVVAVASFFVARGSSNRHTAITLMVFLPALLGFIAALALIVATMLRPSVRVLGYGMCLIAAVDLLMTFQPAIATVSPESLFPTTDFLISLRKSGTRISGSTSLADWPLGANLVAQVHNTSGVALERYQAFHDRLEEDPLLLRMSGSPALILTREDVQGPFVDIRPRLRLEQVYESGAILFREVEAQPRAWMAYEGRTVEDFDDPHLLDSSQTPLLEALTPPAEPPAQPGTAEVLSPERHGRVDVHVETPGPGVLVLADAWYPGWSATVDGEATHIGIVNGLFRGIMLEAGSHDVRFRYNPFTFTLGLGLTIFAGVLVLTGLIPLLIGTFRRRDQWFQY